MLTLYHAPRSRSFRILWLLEELAVPYALRTVSIRRSDGSGTAEGPAYRGIHPHAKVPALIHDGTTVFETPAIALYLTELHPERGLAPPVGDPSRGPFLTWVAYSTGVLEPAIIARALEIPHRYGAFGWGPPGEVEAVLAAALSAGPYLLGDVFSAADILIGGSFPFLMHAGFLPGRPEFTAYSRRLTDRPAHRRAEEKDDGRDGVGEADVG